MDLKHRESKPDGKETRLDGKGPTTYLIGIIFLNGLKKLQNIQLLETIVHCSAQIMISGYDTPLYNDYLHTWDTLRIPNQTTSGVVREEIVWMNYTHQLSLYDFGIL